MTTVINVRGKTPAQLQADANFVYVGRSVPRRGWVASFWCNPFKGDNAADLYEKSIRRRIRKEPDLLDRLKAELQDKTLGCWCCCWDGTGEPSKPCHAVVLARLADELTT